jgi:nitrile hydratase
MNGVHDMGGMHGFGTVPKDQAAFHADWERTAYAMNKLVRLQGLYNIHQYRHSVERMEPAAYLGATYFERWFSAVERLLLENDVLEADEIEQRLTALQRGTVDPSSPPGRGDSASDVDSASDLSDRARASFRTGAGEVSEATDAAYDVGDRVEVRNEHPEGHTRSPRYARGAVGTVEDVLGAFELPDAAAHGRERSEPVYTVEFDARELWGEHTDADVVALDMWESYLLEA